MGIPDHLTCLLRNLYAGQEATVRTGHGTTDWFQIVQIFLSLSLKVRIVLGGRVSSGHKDQILIIRTCALQEAAV